MFFPSCWSFKKKTKNALFLFFRVYPQYHLEHSTLLVSTLFVHSLSHIYLISFKTVKTSHMLIELHRRIGISMALGGYSLRCQNESPPSNSHPHPRRWWWDPLTLLTEHFLSALDSADLLIYTTTSSHGQHHHDVYVLFIIPMLQVRKQKLTHQVNVPPSCTASIGSVKSVQV